MKTTYLQNQMKQFLTASTLFLGIFGFSQLSHANNGRIYPDLKSELIGTQQAKIKKVASQIGQFFQKNQAELTSVFPEVSIPDLVEKINSATENMKVVDTLKISDKFGTNRTCLNFPENSLIKCTLSGLTALENKPEALFVLIFHEYLGLLGIEETSPKNPEFIEGYSISRRLAAYVTVMNSLFNMSINANNFETVHYVRLNDQHIDYKSDADQVCKLLGYSKAIKGSILRTVGNDYGPGKTPNNVRVGKNGSLKTMNHDTFFIAEISCFYKK